MQDGLPTDRRARISRLDFRIRNLRSKRRALFVRVGQAAFEKNRAISPVPQLAEDFAEARDRAGFVSGLEADDVALAASSANVSRLARMAHTLAQVTGKGTRLARGAQWDLKLGGLTRERNALRAKLGRAVADRRAEVGDEIVLRLLAEADGIEAIIAAMEAESGALATASAAMDPRLRRRVYVMAAVITLAALAFLWWMALGFVM